MIAAIRSPSHPLRGIVSRLWAHEGYLPPHRRERLLPAGESKLIFNLGGGATELRTGSAASPVLAFPDSFVLGPQMRHHLVDTVAQAALVGVDFEAGGLALLCSMPIHQLAGTGAEIGEIWGKSGADLIERLANEKQLERRIDIVESFLLIQLVRRGRPRDVIDQALVWLQASPPDASIKEMSASLGLSHRRFAERFSARVGLQPKAYCRVRRFQQTVEAVAKDGSRSWSEVAAAAGYYDQSHMCLEFKRLCGLSPERLRARLSPLYCLLPEIDDSAVA